MAAGAGGAGTSCGRRRIRVKGQSPAGAAVLASGLRSCPNPLSGRRTRDAVALDQCPSEGARFWRALRVSSELRQEPSEEVGTQQQLTGQITEAQVNIQNAVALLNANLPTAVTPQTLTYGNGSPAHTSPAPVSFRGRKRPSDQSVPYDTKRQRLDSFHCETTVVNQVVPLPEEPTCSFPSSIPSPLFIRCLPDVTACVPPLRDSSFVREITLPVAKDKLSQQVLELFQVCQQQTCDLNKKELCRIGIQMEIQQIFPPCYIERPQLIRAKVPIVKFRDKLYLNPSFHPSKKITHLGRCCKNRKT
ncbi:Poly(A) RNA polymerase GLD2 [Aix galericulata]|nr:Poly(A) RNA polymerase GLD2 [Aix galericulata]